MQKSIARPCGLATIALTLLFASYAQAATTEKVLYSFSIGSTGADRLPQAPLIFDSAGNLYGTAGYGNSTGGEVFELVRNSDGTWTENVLSLLQPNEDPTSGVVMDATGNLYGTTDGGGVNLCSDFVTGCGVIYELSKSGGVWTENVIYSFQGGKDGSWPNSLIFDSKKNLYGTAYYSGGTSINCSLNSCGSAFRLQKQSNAWKFNLIHTFTGKLDGGNPSPSGYPVLDAAGNVYATAQESTGGSGMVFEFTHSSTTWKEKALNYFKSSAEGTSPSQGMVFDSAGNLYGTTNLGGANNVGTVFELTPTSSGPWKETVLYSFNGGTDGNYPSGPIVFDSLGNLYGTTQLGGASSKGTVWKLSPKSGGGWTETTLYTFTGGSDGGDPFAGVILDASGNLYGTASTGGSTGYGVVFEIIP